MKQKNVEELCKQSCQVVLDAATFIQEELGEVEVKDIDVKSVNSLVSYVDKESEKKLVAGLTALLPEAVFITEEETVAALEGDYRWIIDPLDGTTNFLHQLPFFAISVGLQYKEQTILGIVCEVSRKDLFYAWKDGGSWLNGKPIKVSTNTILQDAMIATGFPYYDYQHVPAYLQTLEYFMRKTRGIRRFGAAALDLAYVACGRFDAYYEYSLSPWDVAAGALLVEEAGGRVSDFKGKDNYLFGREIIVGSAAMFDEIFETVNGAFYPIESQKKHVRFSKRDT